MIDGSSEHEVRRDDIAAYSIGALNSDEAFELESHLAECEKCTGYLTWLDPAVSMLPASVAQRSAPSGLKRSLLAEVKSDIKAEKKAEKSARRAETGLWGSIWRPVTAGVLTVVLVAGVVGGYALRGDTVETKFVAAESTDKVGAQMVATLEHDGSSGTLHVEKMPPLRKNENYQAWIRRDGEMEPSTVFVVDRHGGNEVAIDGSLEGAEGVLITREPEGGSDIPTSDVILEADLS